MTTEKDARPQMPGQILLPGQAAVAEGPLDLTMMYVMHRAFRRDLAALNEAVGLIPTRDREGWRRLARRWELFSYVLHHHHHGEDEGYWPVLRDRVAARDLEVLEAMEEEHRAIEPVLVACAAGFLQMTRYPEEAARRTLESHLIKAWWHLDGHLAHEETDALPLLQRHLTVAEDERIEHEYFRSGVPLHRVIAVVPWALHGLPEDVRERVLAQTGPVYRLIWLLTRRGFARRDRRTMRHG